MSSKNKKVKNKLNKINKLVSNNKEKKHSSNMLFNKVIVKTKFCKSLKVIKLINNLSQD